MGRRGREVEYLVLDADTVPRRIDRAASAAWRRRDPWVSVPTGDPGRVSDRLREHGYACAVVPEWLMRIPLATQRPTRLPEGYRWETDVATDGGLLQVRLLHGTDPAASGQVGLVEGWAVPDLITTERAHRRRGLGGALMTLLADAARDRGATDGALVASEEGRLLYRTLGWHLVSAVVLGRQA